MSEVAILILAAGASKRMGSPKQLLPYNETTLLEDTIAKAKTSDADLVLVVLGSSFETISREIEGGQVSIIKNEEWDQGMGGSIAKGIRYLQKGETTFKKVLITLCDLPLIDTAHYNLLLEKSGLSDKSIIATDFNGVTGVPVVFKEKYFDELANLSGEQGAKQLVRKNKDDLEFITSKSPFFDVDTPEAYQLLLKKTNQP